MKSRIFLVMMVVMLAKPVLAQVPGELSMFDEDRYKYVVRRGDTLWDLASRFMDNPYDWPMIWQQNPQIEDPHWIYPGDILTIIPESVLRQRKIDSLPVNNLGSEAAGPEEAAIMIGPPGESQVTFTPNKMMGFLSTGEIDEKIVGSINGSPLERRYFGDPDLVYIDLGENDGVKVGDKFTIVRLIKKHKHPVSGKTIGYQVLTLGTLEVVVAYPAISTAQITYANEEIRKGDQLAPLLDMPRTVQFTDSPQQYQESPLEAYIILCRRMLPYMGRDEIAYIDVGTEQGIEPGVLFVAYVPGKKTDAPESRKDLKEPDEIIGEMVVLMSSETYSTVLITKSKEELHPGTHIRTRRFP